MREIRTSGSMSGEEETGWRKDSVSRGAKANLRCRLRPAVPVPRLPPTLQFHVPVRPARYQGTVPRRERKCKGRPLSIGEFADLVGRFGRGELAPSVE